MYELAGRVSAEALTAIARQAYCEMLRSGYTSVAEFHYLHRDPTDSDAVDTMFEAIATAARDSGIRLTYVPVHYERAGFEDPEPTSRQATFRDVGDEFLRHFERVAPSSSDTLTSASARTACARVSENHLRDCGGCRRRAYRCTCTLPNNNGRSSSASRHMVGVRCAGCSRISMSATTGASCMQRTWMTRKSLRWHNLERVAVLCPSTEANLGDGLFPLHELPDSRRAYCDRFGQPYFDQSFRGAPLARIWTAPCFAVAQCCIAPRKPCRQRTVLRAREGGALACGQATAASRRARLPTSSCSR